ncbi:MAG: asparagine--tRNA ligase [Planctomycetales bacterium]|nr:asparagine--tRNA ligase [bacterium]UNM10019.1 MAG: asparagine--tRNA ligase [Planctomycetales bacterium]
MSEAAPHVRIRAIGPGHLGQRVQIRGWLANKPGGKGRYFLWLRDGSGIIQAVAEQEKSSPEDWEAVESIGLESSIIVEGIVKAHPRNEGEFELDFAGIKVLQAVSDYPITKKEHGTEFLMKHRHLWLRGRRQSAILRIRAEVHKAWADFFYDRGFFRVDTPIFTPNACEGTTTLFEVDYHGDTVYLSQSGQLYNEADIGALGQVYCFGPTFRAEKSKTRRHLLEFWMLEMEAAFYDFDDNIRFQEEMIAFTVSRILERCSAELKELGRDPEKLRPATQTPYPRLRYGDAIELINKSRVAILMEQRGLSEEKALELLYSGKATFSDDTYDDDAEKTRKLEPFRWGDDFGAPDEAAISAQYDRPVFVSNFPTEIKGFYFKQDEEADGSLRVDPVFAALPDDMKLPGMSGHTVQGADCIGPEGAGEMIGGSQREDNFERLMENIEHHQLPLDFFQWYLDTRRYGNVPHSGFGIGMERFVAWVAGGSDTPVHIREVITFPRMLHQFEP